jgi:ribosome-binding factor A
MPNRGSSRRGYSRLARVNEALREVLGDELERIHDDRLELVTVTGARVDADLRHALVWYSAMSAPAPEDDIRAALAAHRVRLQAAVGRQLRLKHTPELAFQADPGIAVGTRVEDILRGLQIEGHPSEPERTGDGA